MDSLLRPLVVLAKRRRRTEGHTTATLGTAHPSSPTSRPAA